MDHTPDLIYFKDLESRFVMISKQSARWYQFDDADEAIGKTDADIYKKLDAARMRADEEYVIKTGQPLLSHEEHAMWKSGHETWVSTTKMPLRNKKGETIGIFGISRDITESKNAELQAAKNAAEIHQIKEELEEDLKIAAELQKSFFPTSYPRYPSEVSAADSAIQFHHHYHPGGMIGGDFCSIRKLSETKAGIFLCDVMGHGVRAALGTAIIRGMVEEFSAEPDPGLFLEHMNRVLYPILRKDDLFLYATACYLIIDAADGNVRFANAGHPVPLHFTNNHHAEWFLKDHSLRGPALAISENATYQTIERQIDPGDSVVMFTDGIFEVVGVNNEEYGEDRLIEAAKKHAGFPLPYLFPALIDEACRFSPVGSFGDDVCLVGFRLQKLLK
jgi:sigma-B regulation protein RsbU (phosphoserine phosphatase)